MCELRGLFTGDFDIVHKKFTFAVFHEGCCFTHSERSYDILYVLQKQPVVADAHIGHNDNVL